MSLRALLVALIVTATGALIVGVALERNSGESAAERHSAIGEAAEHRHAEAADESSSSENDEELRPLGIDVEAWPFVTLAAVASLALAAAAWLRPQASAVLLTVAAAMLGFAVLDVREVLHQVDENRDGLATLAAAVGALHTAAGAVAIALAFRARRAPGMADTMPA
jgi:hypothetical protein